LPKNTRYPQEEETKEITKHPELKQRNKSSNNNNNNNNSLSSKMEQEFPSSSSGKQTNKQKQKENPQIYFILFYFIFINKFILIYNSLEKYPKKFNSPIINFTIKVIIPFDYQSILIIYLIIRILLVICIRVVDSQNTCLEIRQLYIAPSRFRL
jgi:magnesium-transporting ATPase (P-type)